MGMIEELKWLPTAELTELLKGIERLLAERDTSTPSLPLELTALAQDEPGYEGDLYEAEAALVGQN